MMELSKVKRYCPFIDGECRVDCMLYFSVSGQCAITRISIRLGTL